MPNGWIDLQQFLVGGPLLLRGVWFDAGLIHSSANYCVDEEHGGWSWYESCGSALGFLAAAASLGPDVAMDLKGLSLSCPWNFVQLG